MQSLGMVQGLMGLAGGVGAGADVAAGLAKSSALKQQAGLDRDMAKVYAAAGADEARNRQLEFAQLAGKQASGYAGGGVAQSGTALQTLQDTAQQGAQQVAKAKFTGDFEAYKANFSASQADFAAKQAKTSGYMSGAMGLLTTGFKVAELGMDKSGTNPKTALGN